MYVCVCPPGGLRVVGGLRMGERWDAPPTPDGLGMGGGCVPPHHQHRTG